LAWDSLEATVYFLRAVDAGSMQRLKLFRFEKITHPLPPPPYARMREALR